MDWRNGIHRITDSTMESVFPLCHLETSRKRAQLDKDSCKNKEAVTFCFRFF